MFTKNKDFQNDEKGQLLLVSALVIAVTFVGLIIILNSVLLTDVIESKGVAPEIDDSQKLTNSLENDYGQGIDKLNVDGASEDDAESIVNSGNEIMTRHYASQRGTSPSIREVESVTTGEYIIDNDPNSDLSSNSPTGSDWVVATGTDEYRQFEKRIDVSSLPTLSDNPSSNELHNNAFYVVVNPESNTDVQLIYVYRTSNGNVQISVNDGEIEDGLGFTDMSFEPSSQPTTVYNNDHDTISLDTTQGTVQDWDIFQFANGEDDTYGLGFGNSDEADGTFRLTSNGAFMPSASSTNGIYSVETSLNYHSSDYSHDRTITIAPDRIDNEQSTHSPNFGIETETPEPPLTFEGYE